MRDVLYRASFLSLAILVSSCSYRKLKESDETPLDKSFSELVQSVSFAEVYSRVLLPKCISCHGNQGGINLETLANARSFLAKIQQSTVAERRMPKSPTLPLSRAELAILAAWIQAGGPEFPLNGGNIPQLPPLEPKLSSIKANILVPKCLSCHGPGGEAARVPMATKRDLVESPLEIVIPGNPEESGFILTVLPGARKPMPPLNSGMAPLKPEEIRIVEEWIRKGALDD